jgi:hypothetical protein
MRDQAAECLTLSNRHPKLLKGLQDLGKPPAVAGMPTVNGQVKAQDKTKSRSTVSRPSKGSATVTNSPSASIRSGTANAIKRNHPVLRLEEKTAVTGVKTGKN